MNENNQIVACVLDAKGNPSMADVLIQKYMPFIKSETYKIIGQLSTEYREDALSIAMFAFYEAIEHYSKLRGAFLPYAALHIKHKIIDYLRKEKRHIGSISLDSPVYGNDSDAVLSDTLPDHKDELNLLTEKKATQEEIAELTKQLANYQLSLSDIADNCPKQDRTFSACLKAVEYAKENPALIQELVKTGKLPLAQLTLGAQVERKTLERHRKYIMAIMIIYSNGYEMIRGHLQQMSSRRKGEGSI